jgi:two-component system LytT family sensor kinase
MSQSHFFLRYRLHHVLFWTLAFIVWYLLRVDDYSSRLKALAVTGIKIAELALMIYITNYVLIPQLLYKKRYFLFAIIFVVMVFCSTIAKMNVLGHLVNAPSLIRWWEDLSNSLYNNIIPHFFLVIAGAAVKLMLDYGELQKRIVEAAREKAEAELNFLKSQINPHFVFNSLNSVYFLIHKDNTEARGALHKFSDMLRYQLYEVKDDKIPIEKEIQYIKDYMDLQQLRKDEKYSVQFNVAPDVKAFAIEPLLLLPFVENSFKHISHFAEKRNFVKVDMFLVNNNFVFSVINSKEAQPTTEEHGGIGLNNVKRRLELLYPNRHELKIGNDESTFSVQLNLQLS